VCTVGAKEGLYRTRREETNIPGPGAIDLQFRVARKESYLTMASGLFAAA